MKKAPEKIKANITLIIAFMIFLFTYCFVMYTDIGHKDNVEINTNIEIEGGSDLISKRLAEIIPYTSKTKIDLKTAYQEDMVTSSNIDNDVFLYKAYQNSDVKSLNSFNEILVRLYSNNLFIVNQDFNVDGKVSCIYNSQTMNYHCEEKAYEGLTNKVYRETTKLNIQENDYYLYESVIFYSEEGTGENLKYQIYSDSTYQNKVEEIMAKDINYQNIEEVLKNKTNRIIYCSKFSISKNNYRWLNTERIN